MSLSKQLYLIISMIFLLIFTGNFIISVKNTKEYLETESITKAQDTATSLGMSLKSLLKDKTNPEIESIINAIGNSGFYKEIRLEDSLYTIKESDIISSIKDLEISTWKIKSIKIDEAIGKIQVLNSNDDFTKELLSLEEPSQNSDFTETSSDVIYNFIPNKKISNSVNLKVDLTLINNKNKEINTTTNLNLNKILVQVIRDEKFAYVPSWFIHFMHINLEEKFSEISDGWQTTAIIYVSANAGEAYAKLYEQVKSAIIYAIIAFLISMAVLFVFVQYLLKP